MASKTTGRLAGLAALGAAAYLYNKDKTKDPVKGDSKPVTENKPVTEKPRNFADVSNDQDRQMAIDAGPSLGKLLDEKYVAEDERPAPTGMGAATKLLAPAKVTRPTKTPATATKPVAVKAPTLEDEYAAQEKLMSAYKPRRPDTKLKDAKFTTKSGNKTLTMTPYAGEEMKRGGKVKKMASGGMTSKRGDGIASKGRTRCKMD